MTERRRMFLEGYKRCGDAVKAALEAGYPENYARGLAESSVKKVGAVYSKSRKSESLTAVTEKIPDGVTKEQIVEELMRIAFYSANEKIFEEKIPKRLMSAISSIKKTSAGIEVKFYDKMKALEILGRQFGLFDERECGEGRTGVIILPEVKGDED